jgi:hypothetical protein
MVNRILMWSFCCFAGKICLGRDYFICCVLCDTLWVRWLIHWCSFIIIVVTTLFTNRSKTCWILILVNENFDCYSIWVCHICNRKAECVVCGSHMYLNVHTGVHTNCRTPNLIMLVSVTSHCVEDADDIGYNALRSVALHGIVSGFMKRDCWEHLGISVDIDTPYLMDSHAVWRCSYVPHPSPTESLWNTCYFLRCNTNTITS